MINYEFVGRDFRLNLWVDPAKVRKFQRKEGVVDGRAVRIFEDVVCGAKQMTDSC